MKLSGALVAGGAVHDFLVSPDSSRVAYRAEQDADGVVELYSAPADGSAAPVRISGALAPFGDVAAALQPGATSYAISSDGATVVFRADANADEVFELFRVPIGGGSGATRVNPALLGGGDVTLFRLGPDGQRLAYAADQEVDEGFEVYGAPVVGTGTPVKLSGTPAAFQSVRTLAIRPASDRIAFLLQVGNDAEIRSAPLDGSAGPLLLEHVTGRRIDDLQIAADGVRVVYATGSTDGLSGAFVPLDLRSVPLCGGASPVRLDDPGGVPAPVRYPSLGVASAPFVISGDSSRVLYVWGSAGETDLAGQGLYSVPIDRSASPVAIVSGGASFVFGSDPAGARAHFVADPADTGVFELYSAALATGQGRKRLSGELARDTFSDVALPVFPVPAFRLDPQGLNAVFAADAHTDERFELHRVAVDGRTRSVSLSGAGIVRDFELTPDGQRAVYRFHPTSPFEHDLRSLPLDGSASAVQLNAPRASGETVTYYQVTPDGSRTAFIVASSGPWQLWSAPTAGGASPVLLDTGSLLHALALTPDSTRALYLERTGGPDALFSVALDGSSAPVLLDPQVYIHRISPVGGRVAFSRSAAPGGVYSVPVDGSASPVPLFGQPLTGNLHVAPDGQRVVFLYRPSSGPGGLYSAPIDGSAAATEIAGPLVAGGEVKAWRISPDSTRVVYLADAQVDEVYELYSVPIDGSASPVRLNAALVAGGDVFAGAIGFSEVHFPITSDSTRVAYVADQDTDEVRELYVVPIDGSASPVKLSGPMVAGGDLAENTTVSAFRISPDSTRVVYCADQESDGLFELFLVPSDGSRAPLKLNRPLARPGSTLGFEITADSRRVVYQATESSQVTELFATPLDFDPVARVPRFARR